MSPREKRTHLAGFLVLVGSLLPAGCAGVPPPPAARAVPPHSEGRASEDPYEGTLLRFGGSTRTNEAGAGPPPSAAPGAVTPTSYQAPYPDTGLAPTTATPVPGNQANSVAGPSAGMVPVGGYGTAPAGTDVVPPGMPLAPAGTAASPAHPSANSPREPIIAAPEPADAAKAAEEDGGWDISKLAPENVWKDLKKATGFGPDRRIAKTAFQEGEALFQQKKYDEAADKFSTASWRWPDSAMEEDSLFLMGECYFFADRYGKADDAYANLLKKYENTRYLDTVMAREFTIGRYWEQMDMKNGYWPVTPNLSDKTRPWFDTFGNAIAAYDRVRLHDPTGPLADDAVMATANAYFRKAHWEDAAYHYDVLRRDYPKSEFQKEAHVLGLQARWRVYQGSIYDGAPLDGAKEIADQTLTQFPGRLGEEEGRVAEARARIIEQKAEREWSMAQFYEKKSGYGAARYYYRTVIEKYPNTQFAERARARLEEIRDKPDNPPKRLAWLTNLLDRK